MGTEGKRLLVLGGGTATLDVVKNAKAMGVYTITTDNLPSGAAKEISDEQAMVSTTDFETLENLIREKNIDGVFCGPSEFNIRNLLELCKHTGLPCYTTTEIWDRCANKDVFKQYCVDNGVDCPKRYYVSKELSDEELDAMDFPVIVKPVDGSSSNGITVCWNKEPLRDAYKYAMSFSKCKRVIVEKYIENSGELFGARYIMIDGEAYPYLLMDTYVVNPDDPKGLISHFTITPSKRCDYYMTSMDMSVRKMLKNMGLRNGTAFFQAIPQNGNIYIHEMGYRLSGGMLFKLTEPLMGINDMKMMIRYALGEGMCSKEDVNNLDINCAGKAGAQLNIPLKVGTIASIDGLDGLKELPCLRDFIQYYQVGDTITEKVIGTLGQHFGRFTLIADNYQEIYDAVMCINQKLLIWDTEGNIMNNIPFDLSRVRN